MKDEMNQYEHAMLRLMQEGGVFVSRLLLQHYRAIGLTDTEAMLVIHLQAFQDNEGIEFPTIEEIQERMSSDANAVIQVLQRLVGEGFIDIDDVVDPVSGMHGERYNLEPIRRKLLAQWLKTEDMGTGHSTGQRSSVLRTSQPAAQLSVQSAAHPAAPRTDVFTMFEQEFARPITPIEYEMITNWLDRDKYPLELIELALREAVFAGKLRFNYIDRILIEWSRNRVFNAEQAKAHTQKFRGR
jgi:DNA replication protein